MPYRPREAICAVCGSAFSYAGPGPLPRYCDAHKARSNRARQAEEARARGEHERAEVIAQTGGADHHGAAEALEALRPLRLASMLHVAGGDPQRAALYAGLGRLSKAEARRLERQAREVLPGLSEARGEDIQKLGYAAACSMLLATAAGVPGLAPRERAGALRQVSDFLERMQTAIKPTFGDVTVVLDTSPLDG
jgi:hypothetical protein